jgi:hypothetical protein
LEGPNENAIWRVELGPLGVHAKNDGYEWPGGDVEAVDPRQSDVEDDGIGPAPGRDQVGHVTVVWRTTWI